MLEAAHGATSLPRVRGAVDRRTAALVACIVAASGCSGKKSVVPPPPAAPVASACVGCHERASADFARHGMARSTGGVDLARIPQSGGGTWIENPRNGQAYRFEVRDGAAFVVERGFSIPGLTLPDRSMRLARTIGAGLADQSFVGEEAGRLYFAPLELFTEGGLDLAPFELEHGGGRLGRPITSECYSCHTGDPLPFPYPLHRLADFHPSPIGCSACHGDPAEHLRATTTDGGAGALAPAGRPRDLEIVNPRALSRERQMDVCARCHAQGDARVELLPLEAPPFAPGEDLFARRAVFVAAEPHDEFGFVSQADRLALSPCFRESETLACTPCHDPHRSTRDERAERYEEACLGCHDVDRCTRPPDLRVRDVAADGRLEGREGCVACHMRRSAPFDLRYVRVTDHYIRRRIPPPAANDSPRSMEAPDGRLRRLVWAQPATPPDAARMRFEAGALGMALVRAGHFPAAVERFDLFPPPGSDLAVVPTAPPGLAPLERLPMFHFVRGLALESVARRDEAERAYRDALRLDPRFPQARLNLAILRLEAKDLAGARSLFESLVSDHPDAENAWAAIARLAGDEIPGDPSKQAEILEALEKSYAASPHDANVAYALGRFRRLAHDRPGTFEAFRAALQLDPSRPGIFKDFGWAAAAYGDFRSARGAIEHALRLDPTDADVLEALRHLPPDTLR